MTISKYRPPLKSSFDIIILQNFRFRMQLNLEDKIIGFKFSIQANLVTARRVSLR